jgi:type II secretion system protein H
LTLPTTRTREAGHTLLEVLLALAIVGAASALVVTRLPAPEPELGRAAHGFAARLAAASEEAVVSGLPVGVSVDAEGYAFSRRVAGEWRAILDDPTLAPRRWPVGTAVVAAREGERLGGLRRDLLEPPAPDLRFDPVGSATAFTLDLTDAERGYRVRVDAGGVVTFAAVGEG